MILSFHPLFVGDLNILCAGREPDGSDLSAIKNADAVILPQGCRQALYEMAKDNCSLVFPDYDARFAYPDKLDQIRLFKEKDLPHPETHTYRSTEEILDTPGKPVAVLPFTFPFVFKFAWGGEGEGVFLIQSVEEFEAAVKKAALYEKSGVSGFLLQEYIPSDKTLRLVRIGKSTFSYWRIQDRQGAFGSSLSQGARIDAEAEPGLVAVSLKHLNQFCLKTKINLAGFDAIFASHGREKPLFLEINYFFGRRGLGGSEKYYQILETEIKEWLDRHGLSVGQV